MSGQSPGSSAIRAEPAKWTVAFASFGPIHSQLFIADGDGNNARPLVAHTGQDYNPSFSRDSQWFVFTSDRGGSADIYRVHLDGTGLDLLVNDPAFDDQAALSPGRKIPCVCFQPEWPGEYLDPGFTDENAAQSHVSSRR